MCVEQRMSATVNFDSSPFRVNPVQQIAPLHVPFRVAENRLPFEFELDDGDGLLHPRHQQIVAQARAFRLETLAGVVRIDGARQSFEGRDDQAVPFFELRQAAIAQGDAEHRRDQGFLSETRAHPRDIVITPHKAHFRLMHQVINYAVKSRASIAQISCDDQFGD